MESQKKRRPKHDMGDCPISFTKMTRTKWKRFQLAQCKKCQNWFNRYAFYKWVDEKKTCPMCRTPTR